MLKGGRATSEIAISEKLMRDCRNQIRRWGYDFNHGHWFLENGFALSDDDERYNLYMGGKDYGYILDENKPESQEEVCFCNLIKNLNKYCESKNIEWAYFILNLGDTNQYVDNLITVGDYMDGIDILHDVVLNMEFRAYTANGISESLSSFVKSSEGGFSDDYSRSEYFRDFIRLYAYSNPVEIAKKLNQNKNMFEKNWSVVSDKWYGFKLKCTDVWSNVHYVEVKYEG